MSAPLTLVELLQSRAMTHPDKKAYTFLVDGESQEAQITYAELDKKARATASVLQAKGAEGERVLLLYPPGLDYIVAFFACLYAGAIAVPAYPPDLMRLSRSLPRLQAIVADAQAKVALTLSNILSIGESLFVLAPELKELEWIATDQWDVEVNAPLYRRPEIDENSIAFLQYTSGSTDQPKGVMLSHENLLYNQALIKDAFSHTEQLIGMSWLPPYHDMGLIGFIIQPLYMGIHCVLMSPHAFLEKPLRWLQAISHYRATTSGGPNFAYDLCARKITSEEKQRLDLSSWDIACSGAEPIHPETLKRFTQAFDSCGFHPHAFYPCYGLSEGTLIVSGGRKEEAPVVHKFGSRSLVGCGKALGSQEIRIVDPENFMPCAPGEEGEIWCSGPSIAKGYWNRSQETEEHFQARIKNSNEGPFLRTGDLGILKDGELFITGRRKDLIIIRGKKYHPQDIEKTVQESDPGFRPGCGAVFSVEGNGGEQLVIVQEVRKGVDVRQALGTILQTVAEHHQLSPYAVVLIKRGTIPKTSSGKIQRQSCKQEFLNGRLEEIERWQRKIIDDQETFSPEEMGLTNIQEWLFARLSRELGIEPSLIDPDAPMDRLGIDSLILHDLAVAIQSIFKVMVPVTELGCSASVSQVSRKIFQSQVAGALIQEPDAE